MLLDLWIPLLFIIYSISAGFLFQKKASQSLDDYFLAGKSLKGWRAGISMAATQFSADTPLLVMGLVATAGVFSLWRLWIYALAFLLMGFLLGGPWRRSQVLTDAEFTELRYSGKGALLLRILKAFYLGTVINCAVLAMVLLAATRLSEPFLLWHEWLPAQFFEALREFITSNQFNFTSAPIDHPMIWTLSTNNAITIVLILAFTTLYSSTGGLRSVVSTDVLQFGIAMIGTLFFVCIAVSHIGGLSQLHPKLAELYGASTRDMLMSFGPSDMNSISSIFIAVLAVQWFAQVNADGTGYLAQRSLACKTDKDARVAATIFTFAQILFRSLLWIPLALALLILYPTSDGILSGQATEAFRIQRESTFAWGIRDYLPPGIRGLMLTGMLAALASTIDTHLNWGSSYWTNDLYKRFLSESMLKRQVSSKELVWVARFSNLGIILIAMFIMTRLDSIQTAWHISLLFGSGLGITLILRWLWHRINLWSEIASGLCAIGLAPTLLLGMPFLSENERLLWMVGISSLIVIAITLLTPPEPIHHLVRFYKRVLPPGFWTPIARKSGLRPQAPINLLRKRTLAIALGALSLYLMLVGLGQSILFWGQNSIVIRNMLLCLLGFALIPWWWKYGIEHNDH